MDPLLRQGLMGFFALNFGLLAGCDRSPSNNHQSHLSVTNSRITSLNEFRNVVQIVRHESSTVAIPCSATVIAKQKLLTAAHCLGSSMDAEFEVKWQDDDGLPRVASATFFAVHPLFVSGKAIQPHDLAILVLNDETTFPFEPAEFSTKFPERGEKVTLVGFGLDRILDQDGEIIDLDVKRAGENKIYTITKSGLIIVSGDVGGCSSNDDSSATGNGDSGGPLFINEKLAGVTLGGGVLMVSESDSCPQAISYFADLKIPSNSHFISANL